jgi:hexosaminidase
MHRELFSMWILISTVFGDPIELRTLVWPPVKSANPKTFDNYCVTRPKITEHLLNMFSSSNIHLPSYNFPPPNTSTGEYCPFEAIKFAELNMDIEEDGYIIEIVDKTLFMRSNTISGKEYLISTLLYLIYFHNGKIFYPNAVDLKLVDYPEIKYRGLMLDTGRRLLPSSVIFQHLVAMYKSKMNILHWHICDDQICPIDIPPYQGSSYHPALKYSQDEIDTIVDYAKALGIKIIMEFDIPAHTTAFINANSPLFDSNKTKFGLDPTLPIVNELIKNVLEFVKNSGTDRNRDDPVMIHLGGDEILDAWDTPEMEKYYQENSLGIKNKIDLIIYWLQKLLEIAGDKFQIILWEDMLVEIISTNMEIFEANKAMLGKFIWHIWQQKADESSIIAILESYGIRYFYSTPFYLDHLNDRWDKMYNATVSKSSKSVMGGIACMWGEFVDHTNSVSRIWPRAAAVSGNLWNGSNHTETDPIPILANWVCKTRSLGIPVENLGNVETPGHGDFYDNTYKRQWFCIEEFQSFSETKNKVILQSK